MVKVNFVTDFKHLHTFKIHYILFNSFFLRKQLLYLFVRTSYKQCGIP